MKNIHSHILQTRQSKIKAPAAPLSQKECSLVSKMVQYAALLEGAMLVFTTGKQQRSEEMFAETSNPFVKVSILFSKMESTWPNHLSQTEPQYVFH